MFTKDSRTENFLTSMGVDFKYTNNIAFAQLSKDWKEKNLSRPVSVREDAVLEYAALMDSGSPAPAPILTSTEHGHDVLDGVQRLVAGEMNSYTKMSAYVVTCDNPDLVMAIRVLANARLQGRPEPPDWTKRRAVEVLIVQRGLSAVEVAKMGGWRAADLEKTARILGWQQTIREIGGPDNLSDAMTDVIASKTTQEDIVKEPKVIAEFLTVLKASQLSAADSEPYVTDFFRPIPKINRAHHIYKERLELFKEDPEIITRITGRRITAMSHDVNLRRLLRAANTVLDEIAAANEPVPYADEFFQLLGQLRDKLHKVSKNKKPNPPKV